MLTSSIPTFTADKWGLKKLLDKKVEQYNTPSFIARDPICMPHRFDVKQDIEIVAFFAAIFAWGRRKTVINKCERLIELMEGTPYTFVRSFKKKDLDRFNDFAHRTFQPTDAKYFMRFLQHYYQQHESLETAFSQFISPNDNDITAALMKFHEYFFSLNNIPERTRKHIATPRKGATCKRLNMFLRWMVRRDNKGVDFGIWKSIQPAQLICPIDVHVNRVARRLGLVSRKSTDWKAALQLTRHLRVFDPVDPVKYDFALFSLDQEIVN